MHDMSDYQHFRDMDRLHRVMKMMEDAQQQLLAGESKTVEVILQGGGTVFGEWIEEDKSAVMTVHSESMGMTTSTSVDATRVVGVSTISAMMNQTDPRRRVPPSNLDVTLAAVCLQAALGSTDPITVADLRNVHEVHGAPTPEWIDRYTNETQFETLPTAVVGNIRRAATLALMDRTMPADDFLANLSCEDTVELARSLRFTHEADAADLEIATSDADEETRRKATTRLLPHLRLANAIREMRREYRPFDPREKLLRIAEKHLG